MNFKRIKSEKHLNGSSLWFTLPQVTNEMIRKLFGTGLASQDRKKYSDSIVIESEITGNRYSLYKSFGEWRVGAGDWRNGKSSQFDKTELENLFKGV